MIDHRQAIDLAATAIDFALDDEDRRRLDEHLRACPSCRAEAGAFSADSAALAALPTIEPPPWVRRAIGRRHGRHRALLLVAAAVALVATVGVALAVGAALQPRVAPIVSPSAAPGPTIRATTPRPSQIGTTSLPPSTAPSASPTPGSPPPPPTATQFPAGSGTAWMGPGPDGGVWVLADHSGGVGADATSVTVLGLLDQTGRPRPGWPVALTGWRCGESGPPHGLPVAADGSIRLVCAQDTPSDGPQRHTAFAFGADGRVLSGWPVDLPGGGLSNSSVIVGDELRVLDSEVASTEGQTSTAQAAAWWLTSVSAGGEVRVGQRYAVADAAGNFSARLAADGVAYRLEFIDQPAPLQTVITAFDMNGVRPGWPITIPGRTSQPVVGPDGLLDVVRVTKDPETKAQVLSIASTGGAPIATSADLPLEPLEDTTSAGSIPISPLIASDGSIYVAGTANSIKPAVVRIGPGSAVGPAMLLAKPLQPQGSCSPQDTGCGTWRSLPVIGPDGTLYVPESAVGEGGGVVSSAGGSLVAIAADGSTPAGWPIQLPDTMAGYWSLMARSDGRIDALAVVPTDRGNQWSLAIVGQDGKAQGSSVLIQP